MKTALKIIATAAAVVLLCGCGGGYSGSLGIVGDGFISSTDPEIASGAHYRTLDFIASRTGVMEVSMSGTEVDSYIILYRGTDKSDLIGTDDNSGGGTDALLSFDAVEGVTYEVLFTTAGADDFGHYSYTIE